MNTHFPYWAIIIIIILYLILPPLYYLLKLYFNPSSRLTLIDYYVMSLIIIFIVVGGYQLYLWCQKAYIGHATEIVESQIDKYIPIIPNAIYIYNFLYYLGFGLCIISLSSYKHFVNILAVGLGLLFIHALIFLFYQTKLPQHTRNGNHQNRFIELTQNIDQPYNAFPSAHVSISILIYFIIRGTLGDLTVLFPILITASCLLTKQHFFIDCIGGVLIGILYCYTITHLYPYKVFT